jgi:hypothetical protein
MRAYPKFLTAVVQLAFACVLFGATASAAYAAPAYLAFGSFWDGIKMIAIDPGRGMALHDPPDIISLARRPDVKDDPIEAPPSINATAGTTCSPLLGAAGRRSGFACSPHV